MKHIVLLLACLAITPPGVQAGEFFRWADKAGKMNYGDVPPADATDVERIKFSSEPGVYDDLPYETRRAQENFPVTLYVGNDCGEPCSQGRDLLNKRGIPFSEKLLRTKEDIDAFKQLSGIGGFAPVLAVGKDFLKGYLESQWNSELDIAGYPKTASYRQRIASPKTPVSTTSPTPETPTPAGQASPTEPGAQ
ncbi:MAG: glutaredoxin family protein [Gallionella sp.]